MVGRVGPCDSCHRTGIESQFDFHPSDLPAASGAFCRAYLDDCHRVALAQIVCGGAEEQAPARGDAINKGDMS